MRISGNRHIYIPFEHFRSIGGPATFMQNLKTYLDKVEFPYLTSFENADSIFFPVSFDKNILGNIKKRKGIIIQRLDGIYYPSKHGMNYIELNREIKDIYFNYSDFIIFQSEYSKKQCFAMLGEKKESECIVILNGADKNIFYPSREKKDTAGKIRFITTGNFRNMDMLEPVIKALDVLKGKFDFELFVAGPIANLSLKPFIKRDYVNLTGDKGLNEVSELLRKSDIFIYSHLNPPCPNSVLEAVSCGLPVVGYDSGSMSELLFFNKDLLAYISEDIFQDYSDFDFRKLSEKIVLAVDNYEFYKRNALEHSRLYAFDKCGENYLQVFQRLYEGHQTGTKSSSAHNIVRKIIRHPALSSMTEIFEALLNRAFLKFSGNLSSDVIFSAVRSKARSLPPFESLRFLFELENRIYELTGQESVRYGQGIHTKHKHIKYHDFFIDNIPNGSRVLDIGCGNGALSFDIARKVQGVYVHGIDIVPGNIETARRTFDKKNISYTCADALADLPDKEFDTIVLSNVLEHIEKRIEFLKSLITRYHPSRILIRVPVFERDWRVPLKKELGIDYRLDSTHHIEYSQKDFFNELEEAGLNISHCQVNWGEIWSIAKPISGKKH